MTNKTLKTEYEDLRSKAIEALISAAARIPDGKSINHLHSGYSVFSNGVSPVHDKRAEETFNSLKDIRTIISLTEDVDRAYPPIPSEQECGFTGGPWVFDGKESISSKGLVLMVLRPGITMVNGYMGAAAPDMYEAIYELCDHFKVDSNREFIPDTYRKAMKAVAKAEGKGML